MTTATLSPDLWKAPNTVSALRNDTSFIITSSPDSRSRNVFPDIPWTARGTPVAIDRSFGFVKDGIAEYASQEVPDLRILSKFGMSPAETAMSRYAGSHPSKKITIAGTRGVPYCRP